MSTKAYTVYRLPDKGCPDGYMKKVDGPAIQEALKKGLIRQNDTWDCNEEKLLRRLRDRGVISK